MSFLDKFIKFSCSFLFIFSLAFSNEISSSNLYFLGDSLYNLNNLFLKIKLELAPRFPHSTQTFRSYFWCFSLSFSHILPALPRGFPANLPRFSTTIPSYFLPISAQIPTKFPPNFARNFPENFRKFLEAGKLTLK